MSKAPVDVERLRSELELLRTEALRQADGWQSELQESKRLRAIVTKLEHRIERLEGDLDTLQSDHETLQDERNTLARESENAKARVAELEARLADLGDADFEENGSPGSG